VNALSRGGKPQRGRRIVLKIDHIIILSEFSVISIPLFHVRADMPSPSGIERADMLSRVYA
jgi:hypothetical protein